MALDFQGEKEKVIKLSYRHEASGDCKRCWIVEQMGMWEGSREGDGDNSDTPRATQELIIMRSQ